MKYSLLLLTLSVLVYSCHTTKYTSPDSFPGKQVIVSEGGGFTGQVKEYILLENGQVFIKTVMPSSLTESEQIKTKSAGEVFERVAALNISAINFLHPGNMTYYLALKEGEKMQEIKWGDPSFPVADSVKNCYDFIREQIIIKK
jgi:hypothetical protein